MMIAFDGYIGAIIALTHAGAHCHETAPVIDFNTPPAAFTFPDGTAAVLTYNEGEGAIEYYDNLEDALKALH